MNLCRWIFAALLATLGVVSAHPVAQGSMQVNIQRGALELRLRVSNEQVFVASAFTKSAAPDLPSLWWEHANYLLDHLKVEADGVALSGKVAAVTTPADHTVKGFVMYDLIFDLSPSDAAPRKVVVRQDLLQEIEFAPGNRWESTFVTRLQQGDRVVREGELFSAAQPIEWTIDWTDGSQASSEPALSQWRLAREYLLHGIHHILTGWDHLLFMTALVLGVAGLWDLVAVVTAFTLAHTITLTLAVLHVINLPPGIVEPMIAISIVAVAAQNLFFPSQTRGWPRFATAFGFGLFHGLGFAGGLLAAMSELPRAAVATAIAAFSLGVEIGHQFVVLPLFALVLLCRRLDARPDAASWRVARLRLTGSCVVLVAGCYYLVAALRSPVS